MTPEQYHLLSLGRDPYEAMRPPPRKLSVPVNNPLNPMVAIRGVGDMLMGALQDMGNIGDTSFQSASTQPQPSFIGSTIDAAKDPVGTAKATVDSMMPYSEGGFVNLASAMYAPKMAKGAKEAAVKVVDTGDKVIAWMKPSHNYSEFRPKVQVFGRDASLNPNLTRREVNQTMASLPLMASKGKKPKRDNDGEIEELLDELHWDEELYNNLQSSQRHHPYSSKGLFVSNDPFHNYDGQGNRTARKGTKYKTMLLPFPKGYRNQDGHHILDSLHPNIKEKLERLQELGADNPHIMKRYLPLYHKIKSDSEAFKKFHHTYDNYFYKTLKAAEAIRKNAPKELVRQMEGRPHSLPIQTLPDHGRPLPIQFTRPIMPDHGSGLNFSTRIPKAPSQ